MAVARHIEFTKYANFNLPHGLWSWSAFSRKISSRSDERLRSYCKFSISDMAAVRHLGFLKYSNFFTFRTVCGHYLRVYAKFRRDQMNGCRVIASFRFPVAEISRFSDFQYGGRPPSWICEICKFRHSARFAAKICLFIQNFVTIGWTVAELLQIKYF